MDDTQDYMQDALALAEMRRLIQDTPASELRITTLDIRTQIEPYPKVSNKEMLDSLDAILK